MILTDIFTFFGRFHPVIVHLPIGFLLLAITLDFVSHIKGYAQLQMAVPFTLLLGTIASIAACVLGFMLASTGDYDTGTLNNHKIAGILVALISGMLYAMKKWPPKIVFARAANSVASIALLLTLAYTGHQGANLTHGENYITIESLFHRPAKKPTQVAEALIFEDIVHPIFERRCMSCHNNEKRKGRLSLADLPSILKGGKHGPSIIPGKPAESELYIRITLDPAHEDFMPKDGKPSPTETEIKIIQWWIEEAEGTGGKKVSEVKDNGRIAPLLASVLSLDLPSGAAITTSYDLMVNKNIPDTLDLSVVDNLRSKGMIVRLMSHSPPMLDVTLPPRSGKKMEDIVNELQSASNNIIWLNLSDNGFTEGDLEILRQLLNLEKLRLEKNPISDGISNHVSGLKFLNSVNLNETLVGMRCVKGLRSNPSIKHIYTWKTKCDSMAYSNY
jgi:uncharacterized membrane protein